MPTTVVRNPSQKVVNCRSEFPAPFDREIALLQKEVQEIQIELLAMIELLQVRPVNNTLSLKRTLRRFLAKCLFMQLHQHVHYRPRKLQIPRHYWHPRSLPNPPRISIVTPSLNQGQFLARTIQSVLDQRYPQLEYAIQDGGSQDESCAILKRYESRLTFAESRTDDGQSQAINRGFARVNRGEIMAAINSDDLLLPGALNYVAAYFADNPHVDVVYGHRIIIDSAGMEIGRWILPAHSDRMLCWANYVPPETLFWRRELWDRVGGRIDETFHLAQDWELLLRFRSAGARFVRLPRFLGAFRVHAAQKRAILSASTGRTELKRLRSALHGRATDLRDVRREMTGYMLRQGWRNFLYQVGLGRQ